MAKISANLGFLWNDIPLADAIHRAKEKGFDAVECHFPYDQDLDDVKGALQETELTMLGINTVLGGQDGDSGLCALTGREDQARASIEQAIEYAVAIGTPNIHAMAGMAPNVGLQGETAQATFVANLQFASDLAKPHDITVLIEPLNTIDKAGYFLTTSQHAQQVIEQVGRDNVKMMFDCYHMQLMEGNLQNRVAEILPIIGHIQFAGLPNRGEPYQGEVCYERLIPAIQAIGYDGYFGAEYIPSGAVEETLDWLKDYQAL